VLAGDSPRRVFRYSPCTFVDLAGLVPIPPTDSGRNRSDPQGPAGRRSRRRRAPAAALDLAQGPPCCAGVLTGASGERGEGGGTHVIGAHHASHSAAHAWLDGRIGSAEGRCGLFPCRAFAEGAGLSAPLPSACNMGGAITRTFRGVAASLAARRGFRRTKYLLGAVQGGGFGGGPAAATSRCPARPRQRPAVCRGLRPGAALAPCSWPAGFGRQMETPARGARGEQRFFHGCCFAAFQGPCWGPVYSGQGGRSAVAAPPWGPRRKRLGRPRI